MGSCWGGRKVGMYPPLFLLPTHSLPSHPPHTHTSLPGGGRDGSCQDMEIKRCVCVRERGREGGGGELLVRDRSECL